MKYPEPRSTLSQNKEPSLKIKDGFRCGPALDKHRGKVSITGPKTIELHSPVECSSMPRLKRASLFSTPSVDKSEKRTLESTDTR